MSIDFYSPTWRFIEDRIKKQIENQVSICTQPDKAYKEVVRAQGAILALKSLLQLPQEAQLIAATKRG